MNIFDTVKITVSSQRGFNDVFKEIPLVSLGQRHGAAEELCRDFLVHFIGTAGKKERLVDVCPAVIERGEQEAGVRTLNSPVVPAVKETPGVRVIAEPFLQENHRAEAAQDKRVDILGGVVHIDSVRCPAGNVVDTVGEKDEILFREFRGLDHFVKKGPHQCAVVKTGLQKAVEQVLLSAGGFLLQGKFQIEQVPPGLAAECLPEDLTVFFHSGFLQCQKGLPQLSNDLTVFIDIAAPDPVDPAVFQCHEFADFRNGFFIQRTPPSEMINDGNVKRLEKAQQGSAQGLLTLTSCELLKKCPGTVVCQQDRARPCGLWIQKEPSPGGSY